MIGSIPAARCSGQLKTQDAFRPPSAVRRSPVSVTCPVLSSKLLFISMRTWRAMGANSCTAFSKWASLSLRVAEPPCLPSRRSSKWRIRLVTYAGIALSGIAYLLLRISTCCTCSSTECAMRLLRSLMPEVQKRDDVEDQDHEKGRNGGDAAKPREHERAVTGAGRRRGNTDNVVQSSE